MHVPPRCHHRRRRCTRSLKHLPEYINAADAMRAKHVDLIACVSANDAFVMDAWGKSLGADDKVTMLADGGAKFARAMGVELDLSARNIGIRSQRYSAIVDNLQARTAPCLSFCLSRSL
jgi:peroxiredoxin